MRGRWLWKKPSLDFFHEGERRKAEVFRRSLPPPPAADDCIHGLLASEPGVGQPHERRHRGRREPLQPPEPAGRGADDDVRRLHELLASHAGDLPWDDDVTIASIAFNP
jgi:hypothetical protein